jgi:hypothetical protein
MSAFNHLPPSSSPGKTLALVEGDLQVRILDANPFHDPIPELSQAFDHEYEFALAEETLPNTQYIVECREQGSRIRSCKIGVGGGPSRLSPSSAFIHQGACIVGAGSQVIALSLPDLGLRWATEVDRGSCLGVFHAPQYESYISWGELAIRRISYDGEVIWTASGKDVFSNGFEINEDTIEVVDFYNARYRIDVLTGKTK